jgi:acyl carrier protein
MSEPTTEAVNDSSQQARDAVCRILAGIAPEADLSALPPDANLRRELDLDSIDFQNFVIRLCKELKINIPDRDAAKLTTLGGCVEYLAARM